MSYQRNSIVNQDSDEFRRQIERLLGESGPRFRRLWNYYRNPLLPDAASSGDSSSARPYRQAQEWGLPARITGVQRSSFLSTAPGNQSIDEISRKEVVIENDIAWRIDTMVDYLFGRAPAMISSAPDAARRKQIEKLANCILEHNGGITFLQQLALLGAVYGFVDVLVKFDANTCSEAPFQDVAGASTKATATSAAPDMPHAGSAPMLDELSVADDARADAQLGDADLCRIARCIRLEIVEPARALPLLDPADYRIVRAYAQVYRIASTSKSPRPRTWLERVFPRLHAHSGSDATDYATVVDLITPTQWKRYKDEKLASSGENSLGQIPLVHIQNTAVPFEYSGSSDVEALLTLQDELNTRLSDRAHRITIGLRNGDDMRKAADGVRFVPRHLRRFDREH